jgi:hypothetical protein
VRWKGKGPWITLCLLGAAIVVFAGMHWLSVHFPFPNGDYTEEEHEAWADFVNATVTELKMTAAVGHSLLAGGVVGLLKSRAIR